MPDLNVKTWIKKYGGYMVALFRDYRHADFRDWSYADFRVEYLALGYRAYGSWECAYDECVSCL